MTPILMHGAQGVDPSALKYSIPYKIENTTGLFLLLAHHK